jgi:colanic acid biosynthesis glycosyl transferase WcaI
MERMNITIWGINYAPEPTGIAPYNTDLCQYLRESGHNVRMVTGFSYYPAWKKPEGDAGKIFRRDEINGIPVYRCWQYVPERPRAISRIIHEASFILTSFLRLLFLPRPDLLIVVSPPLPLGPAAWLLGLLKRCPFLFHVQDMQPDAAVTLGLLKPGLVSRILYGIEGFTYRRATTVSGITRGMLEMFSRKGVPTEKQMLWPNWIISPPAPATNDDPLPPGEFRRLTGCTRDDFLVVYSGNLGKKQGLDIILDAASLLRDDGMARIRFVIAGEGAAARDLRKRVERENLPVSLISLQPDPMFRAMLKEADLSLVTQQKGSGALFFPSKLITLLSAGQPVLTVADEESELAKAVVSGGFGRNVLPDDHTAFAEAIRELAAARGDLPSLGEAGRQWVNQFSRDTVLERFTRSIESRPPARPETSEYLAPERK